ncbi:C1D-domain-containing protein [Pilatotrama ljubarskyi]|nr:C1D-domain-containing protein [Pilatotrama ljubarskyi]
MSEGSEKLLAKLDSLNDSLDDLEEKLEPLLAQTLPESLLPLETIQQVKLNVAIPYLVYDLIFIYLKTRGIDPKTHPVVAELDRVRQYFDKIKNAEDPEKRKNAVDKAAANRFIKHAIAQVRAQRPPGDNEGSSHIRFDAEGNAPSPASISVKVTSKMRERAEYERQLAEQGSEEDDDELEVFGEGEGAAEEEDEPEVTSSKDKGKGRATEEGGVTDVSSTKKRRRPAVDPFTGYGEEQESKAAKSTKRKRAPANADGEDVAMGDDATSAQSGTSTPVSASTPSSTKKDKNAAKKAKKKAKKAS